MNSIKASVQGAIMGGDALSNYMVVSFQVKMLQLEIIDNLQLLAEKFTIDNSSVPYKRGEPYN